MIEGSITSKEVEEIIRGFGINPEALPRNARIICVKVSENCIGAVCVSPSKHNAEAFSIDFLVANEDYRNLGIASILLEKALSHAEKSGAKKVHVTIRASNLELLRLYIKAGFKTIGFLADYFGNGEHAIILSKEL